MFFIVLTAMVTVIAGTAMSNMNTLHYKEHKADRVFVLLLIAGIAVRIVSAVSYYGYKTDVIDFSAWADMLFKDGIPSFYTSDSFTDYPPGYMYILWVVGFIKNTFNLSGAAELILIKSPAMAADMLISVIVYFYSRKKGVGNSAFAAAVFIFNPAVILNSSIWGQVDSVMTLLIVITLLLLTEKKTCPAYFAFAAAVFVKPQACMFAPPVLYAFFDEALHDKSVKNIISAFLAIISVTVLALPFGIGNVVSQYISTLTSYRYVTVNAFNLWAAMGMNWDGLTGLTSVISMGFLAAITLASFYILHKNESRSKYFYTGAFICFSVFMLSAKMHERYAYPTMALMLFALVLGGDLRHYVLYILISLSQFFNTAYILFVYETDPSKYFKSPVIIAASIINILIYLYFAYSADRADAPILKWHKKSSIVVQKSSHTVFDKKDVIIMAAITGLYAVIAFTALGDRQAAQSEYIIEPYDEVLLELKDEEIQSIKYYLGAYPLDESRELKITLLDSEKNKIKDFIQNNAEVFCWADADMENTTASYLMLSSDKKVSIKETAVFSADGRRIVPENAGMYAELFDEQQLVPNQKTYMNSTYFDEIYHARTAYEFIHRLPVYEWTHPPLGKVFISIGIRIFGMTPFGWRFMGTLFGVMMVPVIYIFAKWILKKRFFSALTTLFFAFDFMHYVQTRIATIDVYVTFFIMLMYLFMLVYAQKSFYDTALEKTFIPLGLSGISMGLAIACKWTGIYAALGLAVIFFAVTVKRFSEYRLARAEPDAVSNGISHSQIIEKFPKYTIRTIIFCFLFFVIVPVGIYMLSYIPYLMANGEGISGIWKNQNDIFIYHSKTVVESTHPYSSLWYTWPVMLRPIWYYSNSFDNGFKAGISAFGNPLVWWGGVASIIGCVYLAVIKKDKTAAFLLIAYAANFLPWSAVERTMFIYHYFPSVPFVVLMNGYVILKLYQKHKWVKKAAIIYTIVVVLIFAAFYPVLAGIPVNPWYVTTFLRWLPGWVLI